MIEDSDESLASDSDETIIDINLIIVGSCVTLATIDFHFQELMLPGGKVCYSLGESVLTEVYVTLKMH